MPLAFDGLQVLVLGNLEALDDEPLRVVVRTNGVDKLARGDKAALGDIAFADDLLPGIGSKFIGIVVEVPGDAVYHNALADVARDQAIEEPLFREVPVVRNRRLVGQHHGTVDVAFDGRLIRGEREEQFVKPFDMLAGFDGAVLPKVLRQGQHQAFAVVEDVYLLPLLFGEAVRVPHGKARHQCAQADEYQRKEPDLPEARFDVR